jgi:hypothetical protein
MLRGCFLFIFLLIPVLFNAYPAKAQEDSANLTEIHQNLTGNWSFPDCRVPEENITITDQFYLKSDPRKLELKTYAPPKKQLDYWMLELDGEAQPFLLENDGILTTGQFAKGSGRDIDWDLLALEERREFTHCTETAKYLNKKMLRLMRYIDRIARECTISLENDCARVLFKLADVNNNQKLNTAEIKDTLEAGLSFASLASQSEVSMAELSALQRTAQKNDGVKAAEQILAQYDTDQSKDLTYDEIMTNFSAPQAPLLHDMLQKIGKRLPAFALAAKAVPKVD